MKSVLTTDNLTYMLGGMKLTLEIAVCASVIAILLGTILALAKTYSCNGICGNLPLHTTAVVDIDVSLFRKGRRLQPGGSKSERCICSVCL